MLGFNPVTNTWSRLSDGPTRRYRHSSAVVGSQLYVFGGLNNDGAVEQLVTTMDIYDIPSNTWTTFAGGFPGAKTDMSGFALNNLVYAVGGYEYPSYAASNDTWVFSPVTHSWQMLASKMMFARGDTQAAVTLDGRVFVFGGYTDLDNFATPYGNFEILSGGGRPGRPTPRINCLVRRVGMRVWQSSTIASTSWEASPRRRASLNPPTASSFITLFPKMCERVGCCGRTHDEAR